LRLVERRDGCRARRVVEKRELAEDRAVPFDRDDDLVSFLIRYGDLHRP